MTYHGNATLKDERCIPKGLLVYTIYPARSGSVWIGATGVGIYRYEQEKFTLFHETDKPYWTRYVSGCF